MRKEKYITLRHNQFLYDEVFYDRLQVRVIKIQTVRKFFWYGDLVCYSGDTQQAQNGKSCLFCTDRAECRRTTSLNLLVNTTAGEMCAILELNSASEKLFELLVAEIGKENFENTLIEIRVQFTGGENIVVFEKVLTRY